MPSVPAPAPGAAPVLDPGVTDGAARAPGTADDARPSRTTPAFIARWDLDKTYLRTDFDTVRDLVRTAIERPDQKRTVPGAAALLRELGRVGAEIHILSGSPEQLRSRLEQKLRLDGARWASLTLKPNLENILRLRFRALRGQLGYKLPALLRRRAELVRQRDDEGVLLREVLLGDDAEADAFVYSLFGDICAGVVQPAELAEIMRRGGAYEDTIQDAVRFAGYVEKGEVVERILIHLDRQSSPADFRLFGPRVVPFYNYLQAAFVLHEDGRIPARSVLRVAQDLAFSHNFDGSSLARSYLDLSRRGHVTGKGIDDLATAYGDIARTRGAGASEIGEVIRELETMRAQLAPRPTAKRRRSTTRRWRRGTTSGSRSRQGGWAEARPVEGSRRWC
ncbi:MAG: hypothetical protein QM820_25700 [Minicystis sp.]